jgi:hypothetical protein
MRLVGLPETGKLSIFGRTPNENRGESNRTTPTTFRLCIDGKTTRRDRAEDEPRMSREQRFWSTRVPTFVGPNGRRLYDLVLR